MWLVHIGGCLLPIALLMLLIAAASAAIANGCWLLTAVTHMTPQAVLLPHCFLLLLASVMPLRVFKCMCLMRPLSAGSAAHCVLVLAANAHSCLLRAFFFAHCFAQAPGPPNWDSSPAIPMRLPCQDITNQTLHAHPRARKLHHPRIG